MTTKLRAIPLTDHLPFVEVDLSRPINVYAAFKVEEGGMDIGLLIDLDPVTKLGTGAVPDLNVLVQARTPQAAKVLPLLGTPASESFKYLYLPRRKPLYLAFTQSDPNVTERLAVSPLVDCAVVAASAYWPSWREELAKTDPELSKIVTAIRQNTMSGGAPKGEA